MDIALLSMGMSQNQVNQNVSLALMKKSLGTAEQQGEALQKLMSSGDVAKLQQAAQPHLGGTIDLKL
ncbi:YjfB family protein [Halalkalibacter sp. APA_J-10(15)]|uniref:YjfB family protein n=1 Tax=unclassified Halalkalibacter TaxID=2893063 RepID=UPI001FF1232E|nr:YjfB family protein [Halalkalibacter sp. APA_J-10(15)]MCK0473030.1 YjfB family protein [Halalkalibacter sp. APA_J-10(15)]